MMPRYIERLGRIDGRMVEYARDLVRSDIDVHNEDELLGFRKFLRLLDTYPFDYDYVRDKIFFDAEGEWKKCVTDLAKKSRYIVWILLMKRVI